MIIKQASDLHFTYVRNTPELREAFIAKCNEFGIRVFGFGGENYLEVYSDGYDEFEICGTDDLEPQSKKLTMSDLTGIPTETPKEKEVLDGIESAGEVEWKNGDKCIYDGNLYDYQCISSWDKDACVLSGASPLSKPFTDAWIDELSKPETPQQREERERLEAAYDLYEEAQHAIGCIGYDDFDSFKKYDIQVKFWLAIVDKTNYRKEKTHGTN